MKAFLSVRITSIGWRNWSAIFTVTASARSLMIFTSRVAVRARTSNPIRLPRKGCFETPPQASNLPSIHLEPRNPNEGPEHHRWQLINGELEIVWTEILPSPESVMQLVCCSCGANYQTRHCSCVTNSSEACSLCKL